MSTPIEDTYLTLDAPAETVIREKFSRFLSYAYPVESPEEARARVEALRKTHYDATHHCFAYRIGEGGAVWHQSDDGEPSGTAGRPILGQLQSRGVTNVLVVVVRYFGGIKLGVPGLIKAYRLAAAQVLDEARIVERTFDDTLRVDFPFEAMGTVMRIVKEEQPRILKQDFDNRCTLLLGMRRSRSQRLADRLTDPVMGIRVSFASENE